MLTFGRWVENRLAERDKKGRPRHTVEELLRDPDEGKKGGKADPSFRALGGKATKKVKVKPDGTW